MLTTVLLPAGLKCLLIPFLGSIFSCTLWVKLQFQIPMSLHTASLATSGVPHHVMGDFSRSSRYLNHCDSMEVFHDACQWPGCELCLRRAALICKGSSLPQLCDLSCVIKAYSSSKLRYTVKTYLEAPVCS